MNRIRCQLLALSVVSAFLPQRAWAGPPFLTDDPEPTETGHWEIYGPYVEADGRGEDIAAATGVEMNYGLAPDTQLTVGLPLAWSHDAGGWQGGAGDLELSLKYRMIHDEAHGLQMAVFPGVALPTASRGLGAGRVTALLPIWVQKDSGDWSVFGGGGYAINPGPGNRNYWTGGIAVTRAVGDRLRFGIEADRQGAETEGGNGSLSLGIGAIYKLRRPFRLLASGGPTIEDRTGQTGYHVFLALGLDY